MKFIGLALLKHTKLREPYISRPLFSVVEPAAPHGWWRATGQRKPSRPCGVHLSGRWISLDRNHLDDDYLWNERLWLPELPASPRIVEHPLDAGPGWSCMQWGRRSYADIVKPAAQAAAVR